MFRQKTIKKECSISGIGVHSGEMARVVLRPAVKDHGITIVSSLALEEVICLGRVIPEEAKHATVLRQGEAIVSTIEHLMAAISVFGIDNLEIFLEGTEVPILDGSAVPFVQMLEEVGIEEQECKKVFLFPKSVLEFRDKDGRVIKIEPPRKGEEHRLFFDYGVDFEHPLAGSGHLEGEFTKEYFINHIAPSRTFGFLAQLSILRKYGLAKGASLGNTVVIGEDEILNDLRFEDEFVRHKLLDFIGDLACLGKTLTGRLRARKTGHNFNKKVVEHFILHPEQWMLL